jgi:hypothetical protein
MNDIQGLRYAADFLIIAVSILIIAVAVAIWRS